MPLFYEVDMQAIFNIERERQNLLFYKEYTNDSCVFQFHSQIELYFVDDGEMEFFVNNHRRVLKKGEMSVALSYDSHSYRTPEFSRSSVLIIPTHLCENFILATNHKRASYPFICDPEIVSKIKDCIAKLNQDCINEVKLQGYIYVILGTLMENIFFENSETTIDTQLSSHILLYINENFKNDISLTSIATEFGYNRSYISRYFKSCFGIGINQYITIARLKNALMLMNEKRHSFTHCALESGFNSMRTFYRVFYNEFHCSPKEYMDHISESTKMESAQNQSK
jgi:AraC-like DNA-binding protein